MVIRCECGEKIDIDNSAATLWYLQGGPIKCPNCKEDIYFKKED